MTKPTIQLFLNQNEITLRLIDDDNTIDFILQKEQAKAMGHKLVEFADELKLGVE